MKGQPEKIRSEPCLKQMVG